MKTITAPIQWEITASQNQKKKRAYFFSKSSRLIFILIFFLLSSPNLLLLGILVFVIIFLLSTGKTTSLKNEISYKYKVSESGIEIFDAQNKKQSMYLWHNLLSFYTFSGIGPVGYISNTLLGNDFVIVDKQKSQILLMTNKTDSMAIKMALLQKIKKKVPPQNENIFFSIPSKKLSLTKYNNLNSITPPSLPQFKNKNSKEKGIAEKNFYAQKRQYKQTIQKRKDTFQQKILIIIYIILILIATFVYFVKN